MFYLKAKIGSKNAEMKKKAFTMYNKSTFKSIKIYKNIGKYSKFKGKIYGFLLY